jgi:AraC-like DNA-binding protein
MEYRAHTPAAEPLSSYVIAYGELKGEGGVSKSLSPRPGSTLAVNLGGPYAVDGVPGPRCVVFGIRKHPVCLETGRGWTHRLQVQFNAGGLRRFTGTSAAAYAGKIVPAAGLFSEDSIERLAGDLSAAGAFEERVGILDRFLLDCFLPPTTAERAIHQLAARICANPDVPLGGLLQNLPVSLRQTERYFQRLVGVSPRSLARISRFDHAKKELLARQGNTLTDVGLTAGYFDQAHFGREFRRLADMAPGAYSFCPPARVSA